jgi:cation:H+ antiporter
MLVVHIILTLASVGLLYFGAEWLVTGSALLARSMRIRPMVIGLTVVAFATSAPELAVGIVATLRGVQDMAVGDVIGANVANIGLIIGASALVRPLQVHRATWRKEVPITIGVQVLLFAFCLGGLVVRWEGAVLIATLLAFVVYMILTARETEKVNLPDEVEGPIESPAKCLAKVVIGVGALGGGGWLLVHSATAIAEAAGLTHLTVGATLVAFLTTVPELATSVVASKRGEGDIAVGNAVGSILFNTAFVLGVAAAISPIAVAYDTRFIKIPVMIGLLLVLLRFMRSHFRVSRTEGALLLAFYVGFVVFTILTGAEGH